MIDLSNRVNFEKIKKEHFAYFCQKGLPILEELIQTKKGTEEESFFSFLYLKYKDIIVGSPKTLENIKLEIKTKFPNIFMALLGDIIKTDNIDRLTEDINNIFNYDSFSSYRKIKWGAYRLIEELGVEVCPYCNRNYITKHIGETGKTRPHLDHFLDKAKHPYFAISLFNLIPCCYVCNSSFKGSELFSLKEYLHPYVEGFGEMVKFSIVFKEDIKDIEDLLNGEYLIDYKFDKNIEKDFKKRALENDRVFQILALHNYHTSLSDELINRARFYTPERISEIYQSFEGLFNSEDEVILTLIGLYGPLKVDFEKRAFSKFSKDISSELGLINIVKSKTL
ncbi:hypothetical protein [Metabacillus fastidiosus]|uniref:hypothetical protein n=1 Tax=Metabacillus fastidiosus TaxID=1458 RepID=UPI002DBE0E42|nr:hypothetical protein [Metabacillus fastidiosus]MEC2078606.1 hypothetical protein [Metabacillus fastidiosus]